MSNIPRIQDLVRREDKIADYLMVEQAKEAMLNKLAKKRAEGRGRWHHATLCSNQYLIKCLKDHIDKGDMVDVLNLAAMILARQELYGESTVEDKE